MPTNVLEIVWNNIIIEAKLLINSEPTLKQFMYSTLLTHKTFKDALMHNISHKLSTHYINHINLTKILKKIYSEDNDIILAAANDIYHTRLNDPSITKYLTPFLYFKGFHALQAHRISHWLWKNDRQELAIYFHNHITTTLNVDIHPAVNIGYGIMLDHATGIVIGETSIIENNVSIMQSVTLGSTGKISGNRHPKIRKGVIIGAGSIILGNIEIGKESKIGAGSIVLHSIPPYSTAVGNPAKVINHH